MDAFLSSPKTPKMIHPLVGESNAKFPLFSALSNRDSGASSFGTSRIIGMGYNYFCLVTENLDWKI